MAVEMLVGMDVANDEIYQQYRDAMAPILKQHGGAFSYDFRISEVLKSAAEGEINRVFTICFPSQNDLDAFFSDPDYLGVKAQYFEPSVNDFTIIASYTK